MEENEALKEAVEKLNIISEDEYMQRIADLREKAILDEKARNSFALKKGKEEGKIEVAKKLLLKGMTVEEIISVTGLEKEKILELTNIDNK